ncbi:MAG: dCTP deaminase [Anaerolineae bacterium]|nr:dCTP deaminase [Anaerolineae bacterium]
MGLKPDHWIRTMAQEHGMIEPFVDEQVRNGVISYGLSSYGYDIRIADEFKIFTNVFNSIVDPKNFDPRSMIDFKGEVCVIPPNSFVLGKTVEYFRIPRNVLAVCLGKSTYARCFRGDTRVALVDGTSPTLEDMARRFEDGDLFWGYSIGRHGRIIVTMLDAPRFIGRDSLLEIKLDHEEIIHCTPDHKFIMRDGRMKEAHELRPDDSLMPLYRQLARGYEMIYQPINGHLYPTHRLADEWNLRNGIYDDEPDTHRHHVDFNRLNNNPWNLVRMDAIEHIKLHNQETFGDEFDPDEHSQSIREALQRLAEDPAWRARYSEAQSERAISFWHDDEYAEKRAQLIQQRLESWTEERRAQQSEVLKRHFADPANREKHGEIIKAIWARDDGTRREKQREIARRMNIREEITAEVVREALDKAGSIRGAARLLNCDRAVFRRFPEVMAEFRGIRTNYKYNNNHKILSIKELPGNHDVFCLTVPEAGNFALESGVFVKNCGLIVNTTPFEPAWEGYVTLEISNTTPLPAKIYANEGIAQVLFFEGDAPPDISYADKKGKYQGQQSIVLPKI